MFPIVVVVTEGVFFAAEGVLLGVSASEPRLSSIAGVVAADGRPDAEVVAGEAAGTPEQSSPPFLFLR